jgi:hypothetical protein
MGPVTDLRLLVRCPTSLPWEGLKYVATRLLPSESFKKPPDFVKGGKVVKTLYDFSKMRWFKRHLVEIKKL